jgi:hypothetical protein
MQQFYCSSFYIYHYMFRPIRPSSPFLVVRYYTVTHWALSFPTKSFSKSIKFVKFIKFWMLSSSCVRTCVCCLCFTWYALLPAGGFQTGNEKNTLLKCVNINLFLALTNLGYTPGVFVHSFSECKLSFVRFVFLPVYTECFVVSSVPLRNY